MGRGHKNSKAIFLLWLYFVSFAAGYNLLNAKYLGASNPTGRTIVLYPIGNVEGWVLDALEKDLEKKFDVRIKRVNSIEVPRDAFNPARGQYLAVSFLKKLRGLLRPANHDKVLSVTDVDLYASGLNFVFGEAESGRQCAVISLTRLRQSFYSLPENKSLFIERAKKEAVHELGHVWGLEHCPDPLCVMHFSNSLSDTDKKSSSFCPKCRARLEKLMK